MAAIIPSQSMISLARLKSLLREFNVILPRYIDALYNFRSSS